MGAPPVQRLEHWTLVSSDIDRTKRFYTEVLGAKAPERNVGPGGPVSVDLAGTIIDFFPAGSGRRRTRSFSLAIFSWSGPAGGFSMPAAPAGAFTRGLRKVEETDGEIYSLLTFLPALA